MQHMVAGLTKTSFHVLIGRGRSYTAPNAPGLHSPRRGALPKGECLRESHIG
jgi:hypothetical protein